MMNLQYFCIFMYISWLLKFVGVFCGKLTKPCRHARTFQLVSQQSLASINNKNQIFLTKRPPVATTVPSGTQRHHWEHWYTGVYHRIFDPGPSNPTTFLGLCFPGDYRQSIVSNGRPHLQLYRKGTYIHYL